MLLHVRWKRRIISFLAWFAILVCSLGRADAAPPDADHVTKQVTATSVQDPILGHAQHQLGGGSRPKTV